MPFDYPYVPEVPKIPECYANAHPDRKKEFTQASQELVELRDQSDQSDRWRHELDHDVESVFWLLLYWAMVTQPEKSPGGYINPSSWSSLLGDFKDRERLVSVLKSGDPPDNLTHSVYEPLWPLISSLAAVLLVDRHWLPKSSVRKRPGYICEAFQRLILDFIVSKSREDFMTCRVDDSLRRVEGVPQSHSLSFTPSWKTDELEREAKRRRVDGAEVDCVCAIFEFRSFLLLFSQDKGDNESGG